MNKMNLLESLISAQVAEKRKRHRDQDPKRIAELSAAIGRIRSDIEDIVSRLKPHFPALEVRQLIEKADELESIVKAKAERNTHLAKESEMSKRLEAKLVTSETKIRQKDSAQGDTPLCGICAGSGSNSIGGCDRCGELGYLVGVFEQTISVVCESGGCRSCGYSGIHRTTKVTTKKTCPSCMGTGLKRLTCKKCNGLGRLKLRTSH